MNMAVPWNHTSRTRNIAAAKAFFRKALKRHGQPRTITLDGFQPSHSALRRMGMHNEFNYRWENPLQIRCCQYLNNIVEQDYRRVKFRVQPMLGFKTFYNARRVLIGIELRQKILKGQFRVPAHFGHNVGSIWRNALTAKRKTDHSLPGFPPRGRSFTLLSPKRVPARFTNGLKYCQAELGLPRRGIFYSLSCHFSSPFL
jgi:hypothetical protein